MMQGGCSFSGAISPQFLFSYIFFSHAFSILFTMYLKEMREQRPAPGWDNLHVGAVSRHRLDSLDTSNGLFKKKYSLCAVGHR